MRNVRVWIKPLHLYLPILMINLGRNKVCCGDKEGSDWYAFSEVVFEYSTGLYDNNGREVYEGDILDFDANEWGEPNFVSVVTWDEIYGCWDWGGGNISDLKEWRAVVGNKFENPELLEEK